MKKFIFILLILIFAREIHAQWSIVSNGIFSNPKKYPYGGVITFKDGIVWAGINQLFKSLDSGITWIIVSSPDPGAQISEITFLDKDTGAILFIDDGAFLTNDGGKTWTHILTVNECFGLSFARNGKELFLAERSGLHGTVHYTSDGGSTWSQQIVESSGGGCYDAAYNTRFGKAYVLSRYISPTRSSHINVSTDFGQSWVKQSDIDLDCYSIALDSCDAKRVYLGNEEFDDQTNGLSEIFLTTDDGKSWTSEAQGSIGFFASCFSATPYTVYTGSSQGQGIFRSIDRGVTWKSIAGPNPREDTRLLCAIDDNIILAADQQGNIWRTTNSGGDSIIIPTKGGSSLSFAISSKRIINDSLNITVSLPIYLKANGTMPALDMILHYPLGALTYQHSVSILGDDVDIAGGAWAGRVALHFPAGDLAARKDSLIGWSLFTWSPYEFDCSKITFDSMSVNMVSDPCSGKGVFTVTSAPGYIGSYPSCGLDHETDVDAPRFTLFQTKNSTRDSIQVDDGRSTDEGLKSIWWVAEPGTDTNKIKVLPITPPIQACFNDKEVHTIRLVQLDTAASGCYDFTFIDCLGHESFTKLCVASHVASGVEVSDVYEISINAITPNPFSNLTRISYTTVNGQISLILYDELGKEAAVISEGMLTSGVHQIYFDGSKLPNGNYTLRLENGGVIVSKRMVINR